MKASLRLPISSGVAFLAIPSIRCCETADTWETRPGRLNVGSPASSRHFYRRSAADALANNAATITARARTFQSIRMLSPTDRVIIPATAEATWKLTER